MFKAVKKLKKFWPRKKKKKKPYGYCHHQPDTLHNIITSSSSSSYHSSSSYSSYYIPPPPPPQPSAPPLPPWLETSPLLQAHPDLSYYPTHFQEQTPSNSVIDTATTAAVAGSSSSSSSTSYQQYMDPLPAAYGIPVVQQREESVSGFYTLFVKFGANLFGCFLPCFHIQEVPPRYNKPLELACE
ncbi:hypothetical protein LINPERHAP2_LOCUS15839 [Linum perenne]